VAFGKSHREGRGEDANFKEAFMQPVNVYLQDA